MSTKSDQKTDSGRVEETIPENESQGKRTSGETAGQPSKDVSSMERPTNPPQRLVTAQKDEKKVLPLSQAALKVLALIDSIYRNKGAVRITVLDAKDFLENLYREIDVDLAYFELRQRSYVWNERDSDEIVVTNQGHEEMRNHAEMSLSTNRNVFELAQVSLAKDDYLRRILLLSYLNESKAREYLSSSSKDLESSQKILTVSFLDKSFIQLPEVQKLARTLKKDYPISLAQTLRSYCNDDSFLLALSALRIESLKGSLGLKLTERSYPYQFTNGLRLRFGDAKLQDIVKKLLYLGLTENDNIYGLDLDQVLVSSDILPKLKDLLAVRSEEVSSTMKTSWSMFYSLRGFLPGQSGYLTDEQTKQLLNMNALIISGNQLAATEELAKSWKDVYGSILSEISKKIAEYDNTVFIPFFDTNQLRDKSDKIICSLTGDYFDADFLSKNVVLKLSPTEVGFLSDVKENSEYNAIGEMRNVSRIKARFSGCAWILQQNNPQVQSARKLIEERTTENIDLQEAVRRLEKLDPRAVEMLLLIGGKMTGITAIERRFFDSDRIWNDVWNVMRLRTAISKEDFDRLRLDIIDIVEKKARVDIANFSDEKSIFDLCRNELTNLVLGRVRQLDLNRKRAVYVYLKNPSLSGYDLTSENWLGKFKVVYHLLFGDEYKGEISRTLVQIGLANESTWISAKGNDYGPTLKIASYFSELQLRLLKEIEAEIKPISSDIEEFKVLLDSNKYEVAALEYILSSGEIVGRNALREYLWGISLDAWNQFQPFEGIVSDKDGEVIGTNPALKEELRTLVRERKKTLIQSNKDILGVLENLETIDKKITANDELGIIEGFLVTPNKEEVRVIVSPWFSPFLNAMLGQKTLLILTEQDQNPISKILRQSLKEVILLTKNEKKVQLTITESQSSLEEDIERKLKELGFSVQKLEERIYKPVTPAAEISEGIAKTTTTHEAAEEKEETKEAVSFSPNGESSLSIDEMIFEPPENEEYAFSGVIRAIADRPICIIAERVPDDDYIYTLQLLCRELYRIKVGGNPRATVIASDKRGVEEGLQASKQVFVVDDTQEKFFDFLDARDQKDIETTVKPQKLEERFRELFAQGYGYVIFYVEKERKAILEKALIRAKHVVPQLSILRPKKLTEEEKQRISSLSWCLVEPQVTGARLDYFFGNSEREFFRKLQKTASIAKYQPIIKESLEDEGEGFGTESSLHYALKFFVVQYLIEKEKIAFEDIQTEYPLVSKDGQSQIVPDVYVSSRKMAIEIETLYGTGMAYVRKLARTIEKYQGGPDKVLVLVPNLQLLMFRREIVELERHLKGKVNFEIYGLNIQKGKLVRFDTAGENMNLTRKEKIN